MGYPFLLQISAYLRREIRATAFVVIEKHATLVDEAVVKDCLYEESILNW